MTSYFLFRDDTGHPTIIQRNNDDGSATSGPINGSLRSEFDVWNAIQQPPLSLDIIPPVVVPTPIADWARSFVNNAALWVKILKALDDRRATFVVSGATAGTILTNLRTQVSDVVSVIAAAPAGVISAFTQERVLQGSTTPDPLNASAINAMTAAECRILINVARAAATMGVSVIAAANMSLD